MPWACIDFLSRIFFVVGGDVSGLVSGVMVCGVRVVCKYLVVIFVLLPEEYILYQVHAGKCRVYDHD